MVTPEPDQPGPSGGCRPWAELLARSFAVDVLAFPSWPGRMRLVAIVKEPAHIARCLAALGEEAEVPSRSPGRGSSHWKSRVLRRQRASFGLAGRSRLRARSATHRIDAQRVFVLCVPMTNMGRTLVALAVALTLLAPAAYAVDCDARISDSAGLLHGGAVSAAQRLSDAGADARVVTVSSLEGQGNLDNLFRKYLSQCASWRVGSGIKNNLVVLMVSVGERRSIGLYFDRNGLFATLDSRWLSIQNDMRPLLRAGDFDGGVSRGLDGIIRVATAATAPPPAAAQPSPAYAPPAPEKPAVAVQMQPTDFSGLRRVLAWAVGLGFGSWFVIVLGRAVGRARERAEKRKAAQLRARNAEAACAGGIVDFPGIVEDLDSRLTVLQGALLPEDVGNLPARVDEAKRQVRAATQEYIEVDAGVYDPERPNLAESEYARIGDLFEGIRTKLAGARQSVEAIKDAVAKHERLPLEAEEADVAAAAACGKASFAITNAQRRGYTKVEPAAVKLGAAGRGAAEARQLRELHRYAASIAAAGEAQASADAASAWCAGLPGRTVKLAAAIAAGNDRTAKVAVSIKGAAEAFRALAAEFNRSSYQCVHGNGTGALRELDRATKALAQATDLSSMERQDWDGADRALADATAAMDRADSLVHSVHKRKKRLEKVRDDAQREVEAAAADIDAAHAYLKEHVADVDADHPYALDAGRRSLDEARAKLKHRWPDWPQIAKLAKAANEVADVVLARARSEHEAAERRRQQAATNLREAERACSKLREYAQDHRSDISRKNHDQLDDIERRMAEAEQSSDLALVISLTQSIAADANSAYASARSEVAAATPVYTPSFSSSFSIGGGSCDSGSSFDFGESGGNSGGGSSDF